jgi:hypothetical protein
MNNGPRSRNNRTSAARQSRWPDSPQCQRCSQRTQDLVKSTKSYTNLTNEHNRLKREFGKIQKLYESCRLEMKQLKKQLSQSLDTTNMIARIDNRINICINSNDKYVNLVIYCTILALCVNFNKNTKIYYI